jgi:hypothetical protein
VIRGAAEIVERIYIENGAKERPEETVEAQHMEGSHGGEPWSEK